MYLCEELQGCVNDLSKGKADVFIDRCPDSMVPEDQSAVPFQAMSQDGFFILSPYNCSYEKAMEDSTNADITDTVNAISGAVWLVATILFPLPFLPHFGSLQKSQSAHSPIKNQLRSLDSVQSHDEQSEFQDFELGFRAYFIHHHVVCIPVCSAVFEERDHDRTS